jgi:hypothetical protein
MLRIYNDRLENFGYEDVEARKTKKKVGWSRVCCVVGSL